MKKLLAAALLAMLGILPAQAQLFRAYLSLGGIDSNPCTLQDPCRLLPAALAAVASGGEIWMLDSANFNSAPVTINKSVSILAVPGVIGSVVATGGDAITIATAGVDVSLQNISFTPFTGNTNRNGVVMTSGARLALRNCRVLGFAAGRGVWVTTAAQVSVVDSYFRGNNGGIVLLNGPTAVITNSHFEQGSVGLELDTTTPTTTIATVSRSTFSRFIVAIVAYPHAPNSGVRLYVTDSVIEGNQSAGILASNPGQSGSIAYASVSNTLIHGSSNGLWATGTGARILASGNTITNNGNGMFQESGAVFESAGNNYSRGNINNTSGTVATIGTN